MSSIRDV
jgi:hypothetical protein